VSSIQKVHPSLLVEPSTLRRVIVSVHDSVRAAPVSMLFYYYIMQEVKSIPLSLCIPCIHHIDVISQRQGKFFPITSGNMRLCTSFASHIPLNLHWLLSRFPHYIGRVLPFAGEIVPVCSQ